MTYFYGIDFGTTNSAVYALSVIDGSVAEEFPIGEDARRPLPSYVAINKFDGTVETGLDAKNRIADDDSYEIFRSIKSIIGEDKEWQIAGRTWSTIDIASELFKALKTKTEARTNEICDTAVVAVPVGFSSKKKHHLRKAAKEAGIDISLFVSEPTAAYCGRRKDLKKYRNVAVFDWGGGTLDVSVLQINDGVVKELATEGIQIAGNDIDKKLAYRICRNASKKSGIDYSFEDLSAPVQHRILLKCEQAKCNLADEEIVPINDAKLDDFGMLYEVIEYSAFEQLIEEEVNKAVDCLRNAIANAGLNRETLDCVICEGGSSRLRPLQTALARYFSKDQLIFPRRAMWDIATGVAHIASSPGCYMLNKPIGVMQSDGSFYPLMKAGQRIPTEEKNLKFGIIESTEEARFIMTDGESNETRSFNELFQVKLRGFEDEALDVWCYVDADMIFKMKVKSNRMPDDVFRVWTYSNLKVSYEIEPNELVR